MSSKTESTEFDKKEENGVDFLVRDQRAIKANIQKYRRVKRLSRSVTSFEEIERAVFGESTNSEAPSKPTSILTPIVAADLNECSAKDRSSVFIQSDPTPTVETRPRSNTAISFAEVTKHNSVGSSREIRILRVEKETKAPVLSNSDKSPPLIKSESQSEMNSPKLSPRAFLTRKHSTQDTKFSNPKKLISADSAKSLTALLVKSKDDKEEKIKKQTEKLRRKWEKHISSGTAERKVRKADEITHQEIEWFQEWCNSNDNIVRENAFCALAASSYPVEKCEGARTKLLSSAFFEEILQRAISGQISLHREIEPNELEAEKLVAQGASAKIYKAKLKNKIVALKKFDVEGMSFSMDEYRRELALLCLIQHPNIVSFHGAGTRIIGQSVYLVIEYMTKGSLAENLKVMKSTMNIKRVVIWAREICSAMKYLHSFKLIHRDLKSWNLLLNDDMTLKLIDFGTTRVKNARMTGNMGTTAWMAPEVMKSEQYSEKADVYSFGMILWEMITCEEPFSSMLMWDIPVAVAAGKRPAIPPGINSDYTKAMELCWHQNPEKRPPFWMLHRIFEQLEAQL